jgi:alpha-beta hydrolase superfamily lysophospholipase
MLWLGIEACMGPIVIIGGFLSYARAYRGMQQELSAHTDQPVSIADIPGHEWLLAVSSMGWARLLAGLDRAVQQAALSAPGEKITLIGHSAGGVLARLYLSPDPFLGHSYRGLERVNHLITLGSPHHSKGSWRRGGRLSRYIEKRYPGAYFQPEVRYTSFAGKFLRGDRAGSRSQRWAYDRYQEICGQGNAWGDGLIPIQAALLKGSDQVILDGISHYSVFGNPWYGSSAAIPKWWGRAEDGHASGRSEQPSAVS